MWFWMGAAAKSENQEGSGGAHGKELKGGI
jgi:hypothetical protein